MSENEFRVALESSEFVIGARTHMFSKALIEIYGELGYDFVWLDYEHAGPSPWDSGGFEDLARAAELSDIELLVRLPYGRGVYEPLIRKVLDTGVRNVLIPRVEDADDVRRAVEASRFVHDDTPGERGASGWRSSNYGNASSYFQTEDEDVCVGVMIEKEEAYANLDEILDVPELGFIFIGSNDLSVQLGHPGESDHPEVREAVDEIVAESIDAGVPVGGISHDPDGANELIESGYQVVRLGGDLESTQQILENRLNSLDELRTES